MHHSAHFFSCVFFLFVAKFYVEQSERDRFSTSAPPSFSHSGGPSCGRTLCFVIFFIWQKEKKGAASYSAWTKSNFPNHSTADLTVIIRRVVRAHREIRAGGLFQENETENIWDDFSCRLLFHKKNKPLQTSFEQKKRGDLRGVIQHLCHWEQQFNIDYN